MSLEPCDRCGRHVRIHEARCPFCEAPRAPLGAATLIGATLSLLACSGEVATSEGSAKASSGTSARPSATTSASGAPSATTTATAEVSATASASASAIPSASASATPSVGKPAPTVPHAVPAYGMPRPPERPHLKYGMPPRDIDE